jgi:hypothetical protein
LLSVPESILIGSRKTELPAMLGLLTSNHAANLFQREFRAGVFLTVGDDHEDHKAGRSASDIRFSRSSASSMAQPTASSTAVFARGTSLNSGTNPIGTPLQRQSYFASNCTSVTSTSPGVLAGLAKTD